MEICPVTIIYTTYDPISSQVPVNQYRCNPPFICLSATRCTNLPEPSLTEYNAQLLPQPGNLPLALDFFLRLSRLPVRKIKVWSITKRLS